MVFPKGMEWIGRYPAWTQNAKVMVSQICTLDRCRGSRCIVTCSVLHPCGSSLNRHTSDIEMLGFLSSPLQHLWLSAVRRQPLVKISPFPALLLSTMPVRNGFWRERDWVSGCIGFLCMIRDLSQDEKQVQHSSQWVPDFLSGPLVGYLSGLVDQGFVPEPSLAKNI